MSTFKKTRDEIPNAKYIDENPMSVWQMCKISWFMMVHNNVTHHYNFTDEMIDRLRKKHGSFYSRFDLILSVYWKFLMINSGDKESLFNIVLNAKNRVDFMDDKYIGNSFTAVFAEGKQSDTLEQLGQSVRKAINSFNQD